ncbi:MAG: hypothetical protein RLZZ303_3555 [Candidatus Hydrogenedentota bacterium]|jgi:PAS domain S-box-containing protein
MLFPTGYRAATLATLILLFCAAESNAAAQVRALEKVTLQLKWRHQFQFAGYYVAQEKGYYRDVGLDVEILEGMPGQNSVDDLVSGRAQYAVGMPALMVDHAKGAPLIVLAAIFQHSPEVLLTLESSGINSPEDLVGRRLAIEPISTPAIMAMLKAVGLGESDYASVPLLYEVGQLVRGEADAMAAYDTDKPFNLAIEGYPYRIIRPSTYGIDFYGDCLYTSQAELSAHPSRVKRFREASLRGWRDAMEDIDGAIAIIQSRYRSNLSAEHLRFEANATQQLMLPELVDIGHMSAHRWEQIRRTFVSLGAIPEDYALEGFVYDPEPTISLDEYERILTIFVVSALVLGSMLAWAYLIARRRYQQVLETRMILDTAVQAIITSDERGIINNANRGAVNTFGYAPGTMEGINFEALFAPESLVPLRGIMAGLVRQSNGRALSEEGVELTGRRRDGTRFPARVSLGFSSNRGRQRLVAIVEDVSERKRFERELQDSDRLLRAVIENMAAVFFIKDRQGRHLMVNKVYETATGFSKETVLHKTDAEFFSTAPAQLIMELDDAVMREKKHRIFEESVPHPDGTLHTYHTEKLPLIDDDGEVYGLVGIATDITDRKRMEEELRSNQERLDLAVRGASLGLWDWEPESGRLIINDVYAEMLGYSLEEFETTLPEGNERWNQLVHPDDVAPISESLRRHFAGETPMYRVEARMRTKSGAWKWTLSVGRIADQRKEGPTRMVGINLDIDDFKRLQVELEQAREAAEAAGAAKARFLANMSHEIRTPLNAVLNLTDFILDTPLDERQRQYLRVVHNSAKGLLKVINDVLDLSKIEAGRIELERVSFGPRELMEDLVLTFSQQAANKGIRLASRVEPATPARVAGDAYRIRQILLNLIGNAIKFTESGEVSVSVSPASRTEPATPGETWLRFSVRDTGIGLNDEQLDRIFDAFAQADSSTTRRFGGTGLGLAISRRLVENLGGDGIAVDSVPGEGSCFRFELPLSIEAVDEVRPADNDHVREVLVLDDNVGLHDTYANIIERLGARVSCVATAEEAKELLGARNGLQGRTPTNPFEAMLVDWHARGSDALALLSDLRDDPATKELPIVAIVNAVTQTQLDVLRSYRATAVLNKPVSPSTLQGAIASAIGLDTVHDTSSQATRRADESGHSLEGLRVLLVEDNVVNQMVAREMLRRENCHVQTAANGRIALERLEAEDFDIVLLDVQMPEMDGLEATREIRRREAEAARQGRQLHVPIIAMTANAMQGDEKACLEAGMDGYVPKPVVKAEVIAEILRVLQADLGDAGGYPHDSV